MPTFASCYSGIGGVDAGFAIAGYVPLWQAEIDPYRQAVLRRHFGIPVYASVAAVSWVAPAPDVLYAEFPDARVDDWWARVVPVVDRVGTRRWLVLELSPTVRYDAILRAMILRDYAFRVVHVTYTTFGAGMAADAADKRVRAFIFASRDVALVDGLGLAAMAVTIEQTLPDDVGQPVESVAWHEVTRGLRAGWTCACQGEPCACDPAARRSALRDATSPLIGHWLGALLAGDWTDGQTRALTEADGTRV